MTNRDRAEYLAVLDCFWDGQADDLEAAAHRWLGDKTPADTQAALVVKLQEPQRGGYQVSRRKGFGRVMERGYR